MSPITTTIENNELEAELQELVLIGKQWISELDFLQCELEVLNKLFKKASFMICKVDFDKRNNLEKIHINLRNRIQEYLQILEALVINPKHKIDISLVDSYTQLARELEQVLQRLLNFKNKIFNLNKSNTKSLRFTNRIECS